MGPGRHLLRPRALLEGFLLDNLNVGIILHRSGPAVFAMYLALAEGRGTPWTSLRGIVTNNSFEGFFIFRMRLFPRPPPSG